MNTQTIQIGIDLGTTNSEIAINVNGKVNIIKNINQDQFTPSSFGVDKFNNMIVGKKAFEKLYVHYSEEDASNFIAEVKRLMGSPEKKHFSRLNKSLLPEEISAEILKSLRADVLRNHPDMDASSAVITVPASFSTLQSEATKRAGNLAGFDHVVLLQEPIAAAIAYGFANSANENWLVYDLGGGTFDAALISYQDGLLNILGHEGDNFLGGKNFDWLLVDTIIVPQILKEYKLKSFSKDNKKYHAMFAILKGKAEEAKIELSQIDKTTIEIGNIGKDDDEKEIYLQIQIKKDDLESLIEPTINKSIELVKKTIKDTGIKKSSIARIILIGGPTQIPYVRKRLKDEFEVKIDTSVDPFTAVAYGACIFATGQKIPEKINTKPSKERKQEKGIKLNYESMTSDSETMISGIIEQFKNEDDEYFIQIQSESGLYNSPKLKLKKGKFIETIPLEKNKSNLFWIYLFDNKGNSLPLSTDSFSITQGLTIKGVPLPHSVGVSYVYNNVSVNSSNSEKFDVYFEKGSTLPLTKTKPFHTARKLEKNKDNILPIKIYEGEAINPQNNTLVCGLDIKGDKLPYDLPAGTDIDITININESRELTVSIYIPTIDLSENARATIMDEKVDLGGLKEEYEVQKKEVDDIKNVCNEEEKTDFDNKLLSINRSLRNASSDEDEKKKVSNDIKELKNTIDEIKKNKELPKLISEFNEQTSSISQIIKEFGVQENKESDLDQLNILIKEGKRAIEEEDKGLLRRTNEQLKDFGFRVFYSNPNSWLYHYQDLSSGKYKFTNDQEAQYYLKKGREAIDGNDTNELKRCVRELINLLPEEDKAKINSKISGITK
jgi:molecular chaperone DnaK